MTENHDSVNIVRALQKEFIRNAINDAINEDIEIPLVIENDDSCNDASVPAFGMLSGSDANVPVEPIPGRQVLSLRGVRSKPPIIKTSNEGPVSSNVDSEIEKLHTIELNIIARLFYKLITTFKHS